MNFEQPQTRTLKQAIADLYFGLKNGERSLRDNQVEDFLVEAKKLNPKFARDLPARGLQGDGIVYDFKMLADSLQKDFEGQFWGSFYFPGVEEEMQRGGLGYGAKNDGFMLIGTPGKTFNRASLSAVLVPRQYEEIIDSIRQEYPDVKFITVDEIKDLPNMF